MKVRYEAYSKSGPQPIKKRIDDNIRALVFGPDHVTSRWGKCTPKTAAEVLEVDDSRTKDSDNKLSPQQRLTLLHIAGEEYGKETKSKGNRVPANPYTKRKGETIEDYVKRINSLTQ